jgi:hypothetical protein
LAGGLHPARLWRLRCMLPKLILSEPPIGFVRAALHL